MSGEALAAEGLLYGWTPRRVGRRVLVLPETGSTNGVALDAAAEPDADGLAVLAEHQTAGRGRLGRTWTAPRGAALLCSVLLIEAEVEIPSVSGARTAGLLTPASAVAACEAVREATDVTAAIKWPNDIRVGGRKLGGILIESRPIGAGGRAWAVGIGLNCLQQAGHFPPELRDVATSLEIESRHAVDRVALARALLRRLDAWLAAEPAATLRPLHEAWQTFAEPVGQHVRLRCEGREYAGRTIAVDPAGGLILQLDSGGQAWFDPLLTTLL